MLIRVLFSRSCFLRVLLLAGSFSCAWQAHAQPALISSVPANGATGVSVTTNVVFTFSTAMNTSATSAIFIYDSTNFIFATPSWSAGNTVLTCSPAPATFPANKTISWFVNGQSSGGIPLSPVFGSFTTGGGSGGGGGTGTNAITTFSLGKTHFYRQTSAALPTLDPDFPYAFNADTSLSSNRTATNVLLTLPTSSVSNLTQNLFRPEVFSMFSINTNLTSFEALFPAGSYVFNVQASSSNQTVPVNFPAAMLQPGAPHVSNFNAAQAVNPSQPFALTWDAFPGGTVTDVVVVVIGDSFSSTNIGSPGALNGTATSITLPAGTLAANSNYSGTIGFYRYVFTTNGTSYATFVARSTITDFSLATTSGSVAGPLILTNAVHVAGTFSFDVLCSPAQTLTVEYRTNLSAGSWQTLLTTNSPGNQIHAVAPQAATNSLLFFRARNGP
jgi:Bacterial Ig-like domain